MTDELEDDVEYCDGCGLPLDACGCEELDAAYD